MHIDDARFEQLVAEVQVLQQIALRCLRAVHELRGISVVEPAPELSKTAQGHGDIQYPYSHNTGCPCNICDRKRQRQSCTGDYYADL